MPAVPLEVGRLRRAAGRFAVANGVPEPPLEALKLALSEAASNAVLHAYRHSESATIYLGLTVEPNEQVEVIVRDHGEGINPHEDSPGGGFGLPLIASLADDVHWGAGPNGSGTEVRMRFALD